MGRLPTSVVICFMCIRMSMCCIIRQQSNNLKISRDVFYCFKRHCCRLKANNHRWRTAKIRLITLMHERPCMYQSRITTARFHRPQRPKLTVTIRLLVSEKLLNPFMFYSIDKVCFISLQNSGIIVIPFLQPARRIKHTCGKTTQRRIHDLHVHD